MRSRFDRLFLMMKPFPFSFSLLLVLGISLCGEKQEQVFLWPGNAPGEVPGEVGEETVEVKGVKRVSNVTKHTITYYNSIS